MLIKTTTKKLCIFCCLLSVNILQSSNDINLSRIEKSIKKTEEIGTKTTSFLEELNNSLPKLIQELTRTRGFDITLIKTILKNYRNIRIIELFQFKILQEDKMDQRLIPLLFYIVLESSRIVSISNIENQKIYMPINKCKNYELLTKKIESLETTINYYVKQINEKTSEIKENVKKLLKIHFNLEIPEITATLPKSNKVEKILKTFGINYNSLIKFLNINKDELVKEFKISLELFGDQILKQKDIDRIGTLAKGSVFEKIKSNTNIKKLEKVIFDILSELSDSIKKSIDKAKKTIFKLERQ